MNDFHAALDSNCLSYLLSAASGEDIVNKSIRDEGVALIRLWFYVPCRFYITDTVASECSEIKDVRKKALHSHFTSDNYWGVAVRNHDAVKMRAATFNSFHPGVGDCFALAEAEDAGLKVLLSYDKDFLKVKDRFGSNVALTRPSELWADLDIPRGAKPVLRPGFGNPLENQQWWIWQ